jgi:hypothetical protein
MAAMIASTSWRFQASAKPSRNSNVIWGDVGFPGIYNILQKFGRGFENLEALTSIRL